jgi:hypothetical protein
MLSVFCNSEVKVQTTSEVKAKSKVVPALN